MSRQARAKSSNGIYHVMLRGINQQHIFEDEEDNRKFLEILNEYKAICEYQIFAYCLMGNHLHLLLKVGKEDLEQIFKRIGASYVYWYNWKYHRIGHLFQDRYKSEPIENDEYFLTVLRYIHQNPVKAGICKTVDDYQFSSYKDYINQSNQLVDTEFAVELLGKSFIEFNEEISNDKCLELDEKTFRLTDDEAHKVIFSLTKCKNTAEFQTLDNNLRDIYIKKLKQDGMSIRQISRLTGISKGIVEKL